MLQTTISPHEAMGRHVSRNDVSPRTVTTAAAPSPRRAVTGRRRDPARVRRQLSRRRNPAPARAGFALVRVAVAVAVVLAAGAVVAPGQYNNHGGDSGGPQQQEAAAASSHAVNAAAAQSRWSLTLPGVMVVRAQETPPDAAVTCDDTNGPVRCKTCASATDADLLTSLPRRNRHFSGVSSNLGTYALWTCTRADPARGVNASCSSALADADLWGGPLSGVDSDQPENYTDSLLMYLVFGLFMAAFMLTWGCCLLCGRYVMPRCVCYCNGAHCCAVPGGCWAKVMGAEHLGGPAWCGKRYPTRRTEARYRGHRGTRLGFTRLMEPGALSPLHGSTVSMASLTSGADSPMNGGGFTSPSGRRKRAAGSVWGYTNVERWFARLLMVAFVLCVGMFILEGQLSGNQELAPALKSAAAAPAAVVDVFLGARDPVAQLVQDAASHVLPDMVQGFADAVTDAVDLDAALAAVECVGGDGPTSIASLPPDVGTLVPLAMSIDASIAAVATAADADAGAADASVVGPALALFASARGAVEADAATLDAAAIAYDSAIGGASGAVVTAALAQGAASSVGAVVSAAVGGAGDGDGGVDALSANLTALTASAPAPATIDDVTGQPPTSAAQSLTTLKASEEDAAVLIGRLDALAAAYRAMPNFTETAAAARRHNERVATYAIAGAASAFDTYVSAVNESVPAAFAAVTSATAAIQAALDALAISTGGGLTGLDAAVSAIDAAMASVESAAAAVDFTDATSQVTAVQGIAAALPCMRSLAQELKALNATIVELPQALSGVSTLADTLNDTLVPALDGLDGFASSEAQFAADLAAADVPGQRGAVATAGSDLAAAMAAADVVAVGAAVHAVNTALAALDAVSVAAHTSAVVALNTSLAASTIADASTDALQAHGASTDALVLQLEATSANLAVYMGGHCDSGADFAQECSADVDCDGAALCVAHQTKRCRLNLDVACVTSGDADCVAPGDYCVVDDDRVDALIADIEGVAAAPDMSAEVAALAAVSTAAVAANAAVVATDGATIAAANAMADPVLGLVALGASASNVSTAVAGFTAATSVASFDTLVSALGAINVTDATSSVADLADAVDEVAQSAGDVATAHGDIAALHDFITAFVPEQLARLTSDALDALSEAAEAGAAAGSGDSGVSTGGSAVLSRSGPRAVMFEGAAVADALVAYLAANTTMFASATSDMRGQAQGASHLVSALTDAQVADAGPFHFFGTVVMGERAVVPVTQAEAVSESGGRVYTDADGMRHSNGRHCLTNECVANTVDWVDDGPLVDVTDGWVPLPLGRNTTSVALYVVVGLTAALGAAAMALHHNQKASTLAASIAAALIFAEATLIFALYGTAWPLTILAADVCYGAENAGFAFITTADSTACTQLLGGEGTAAACVVPMSAGVNVTIDIPHLYTQLLGGCGDVTATGADAGAAGAAGTDPVSTLIESIRVSTVNAVHKEMSPDGLVAGGLTLRPAVLAVMTSAADAATGTADTLFRSVSDAVGCAALHDAYAAAKESLCCGAMQALYWSVASWYLIGWAMCCCGAGAAVLGRKRFPQTPWGVEYDTATGRMTKLKSAATAARIWGATPSHPQAHRKPDLFASGAVAVDSRHFGSRFTDGGIDDGNEVRGALWAAPSELAISQRLQQANRRDQLKGKLGKVSTFTSRMMANASRRGGNDVTVIGSTSVRGSHRTRVSPVKVDDGMGDEDMSDSKTTFDTPPRHFRQQHRVVKVHFGGNSPTSRGRHRDLL